VEASGAELLYCDTDSVIYVQRDSATPAIVKGKRLGEMAQEMPKRRIIEFLSAGPKNYGLRHVDRETGLDERAEMKIKGIELTYAASQLITFNTMRALILSKYDRDEGR
jgi:hypothetical protein